MREVNKPLALVAYAVAIACFPAMAETLENDEEADEFSAAAFYHLGNQPQINVERFRYRNSVAPGSYLADVFVNDQGYGQFTLRFADIDGRSRLCLTRDILDNLEIRSVAIENRPKKGECLRATQVIPKANFHFDNSKQQLNIELPQELVITRPRGYIPPSRRENGVPALFVNYRLNRYETHFSDNQKARYTYLGLRGGATWNGWTIRHRGSYTQYDKNRRYQAYSTYLQHDIDTITGRLTLGDFNTYGRVADSITLRGVSIASDLNMLPNSQQGFAPSVKGVANSNARVTVYQNGNIIYETTVPPGPFSIDDLYPTGSSGDLEVEITEDSGAKRRFTVPFASNFGSVRQGHLWYEVATGRYRENTQVYPINVFQTSLQYGLNNALTLNAGATVATRYYSGHLGFIWQTKLGAFEVAGALSRLQNTPQSPSLKFTYSKSLFDSNTYLYANAEHFFEKRHYYLRDAIPINDRFYRYNDDQSAIKAKYRISLNQRLGKSFGNLYLSGTANRYHQSDKTVYGYQVGYSNNIQRVDFQLGYWREQRLDKRIDSQLYVNLSIPFSVGDSRNYLRSSYTQNRNKEYLSQTSLYGTAGQYNQFSYGTTWNKRKSHSSYSFNAGYKSSFATLNATHSRSQTTRQQSYEVAGGIVLHPHGVTLSSTLGDTFAIISAKGATNARVRNQMNHRLDYFGNAVVPHLIPYRVNTVGIDIDDIPDDVDISATSKEIVPRANTVNLVKLSTQTGKLMSFTIKLPENKLPPMGAEAFNLDGQSMGYVGQGGQLFIRSDQTQGEANIIWGSAQNEQCRLHYDYQETGENVAQCQEEK